MEVIPAVLRGVDDTQDVIMACSPFHVGRSKTAQLVVPNINISRSHCTFLLNENQHWLITDSSSSGTFVNGCKVGKEFVALVDGDVIQIGADECNLKWTFYSSPCREQTDTQETQHGALDSTGSQVKEHYLEKIKSMEEKLKEMETTKETLCNQLLETNESHLNEKKRLEEAVAEELRLKDELLKEQLQERVKSLMQAQTEMENKLRAELTKKEMEKTGKSEELTKELMEVKSELSQVQGKKVLLEQQLAEASTAKEEASKLIFNFSELLETELQCTICNELFVTAVTLNCTHTFCRCCIDAWKKKKKTCPICRKRITSENRSLVMDNYIDRMVESLSEDLKLRRQAIVAERKSVPPKKPKLASEGNITVVTLPDSPTTETRGRSRRGTRSEAPHEENYVAGLPGQYYGGYGTCWRCGAMGHWAQGCPDQ